MISLRFVLPANYIVVVRPGKAPELTIRRLVGKLATDPLAPLNIA
jgi:hypothetical protein